LLCNLLAELKRIPGPFRVCYEASCGYGVLHEALSPLAQNVQVAHPGHLRLIFRSKRKNNRLDAARLAKLLYLGEVPAVHVPPKPVRQWRQVIEFRQRLLGERVRVKNRIRAFLRGEGIDPPKSLWSRKGIVWLKALELEECCALQRDLLEDQLREQNQRIERVESCLARPAEGHPGIALLRTIPGVGPRTAEALIAYIDDVKRFGSVKQVGCYFGMVPCQDASGDQNRLGHITRDGPATVRKLICEAAWTGIRRSPTIKAYYQRVQRGDPERKKIALVATAHYLLRVAAALLRSGECWREAGDAQPRQPGGSAPQTPRNLSLLGPPAEAQEAAPPSNAACCRMAVAAALGSDSSVALSSAATQVSIAPEKARRPGVSGGIEGELS